MRKWLSSGIVLAGSAVMVLSSVATAAVAPTGTASGGSPGQGLEISPPVIELNANPGQTITTTIRVRNVTQGELIAKGKADDFGAGTDESGQPKLLLDETGATRYSLKYWVNGVPDLDLAPGELKTATIVISLPANAEPGGHFGVVRFTAVAPNLSSTGVALSASLGALILLKVSGPVTDKASLVEFSSLQNNKKASFFEHGPVGFVVRVKNEGSVHEQVKGNIVVKDTFGKTVGTVAVNDKGGNILPDSIRKFEEQLGQKQLFGVYSANLSMTYAGKYKLSGKTMFWVIPWKLVLLALLGLIVLVYLMRVGLRRYNQSVVDRARRG